MPTSETVFSDFFFSLRNLTPLQALDIALVALVFFLLLNLLRRSRATVLLRGTLVLLVLFFLVTLFLPLPTFDYLLELALLATLIAIPIIFQPELRRLLEELGRRVGSLNLQRAGAETTLKPVSTAVENLAGRRTGALVVLEGNDDLSSLMETGVPVHSELTSELLQTIFYDGTPLHDGAVLLRGNRVLAAGCVLPVSNRNLYAGQRRLGTRHRAALGLAESSDALIVVVSEETGAISVARDGQLFSDLEKTELREHIHSFYRREEEQEEGPVLRQLWEQFREWAVSGLHVPRRGDRVPTLMVFILSILLALATWSFIIQETNPIRELQVNNISLQVSNVPPRTTLDSELPESVSAIVKAPDDTIDSLGPSTFQAQVSLAGLEPNLHRVPVFIESSVRPVQIVSVNPDSVDVELVEIITRTVEVQIEEDSLELPSPALELSETPVITPTAVTVSGAAPLVESIDHASVELPAIEASGEVQRMQEVTLVDEDGLIVNELEIEPERVQIQADITQRADAREVAVRAITDGMVPDGYRLVELLVQPERVTLLGSEEALAEIGNIVETLPVDLSQAVEDIRIQIPLNLPLNVDAVGPQGNTVRSVLVTVEVEERTGHRILSRPVEIEGSAGLDVLVEPNMVELLVRGPLPILSEIDAQPRLVRVVVEATGLTELEQGQSVVVTPRVVLPDGLRAQLTPSQVRVTAP